MSNNIELKEKVINHIKQYFKLLNKAPTQLCFKNDPSAPCSATTLKRLFGTFNAALEMAGAPTKSHQKSRKTHQCPMCGKETKNPKFCSRSCAAKTNNTVRKRKPKVRTCTICGDANLFSKRSKYCFKCYPVKDVNLKTLEEVIQSAGKIYSNRYAQIHENARRLYIREDSICYRCGYKLHIEVCHIKPISKFSITSTIEEINAPDNILLLCPNCHWEFDNKKWSR